MSTLACAYAENGDFNKAIETEQKALSLAANDDNRAYYRKMMKAFEEGLTYLEWKARG